VLNEELFRGAANGLSGAWGVKRAVKSIKYSPQSKEQNPQQAKQGHAKIQQCL
jgi:hypothetical protein